MQLTEARKTFVLWVGAGREVPFQGRLEDVDTGREFRFRCAEELIAFLKNSVEEGCDATD
jgi:hypothetical protein